MWKKSVFALLLGSALLVGCNDNAVDDVENDVNDVGNDIQEGVNDVQEGVDETIDDGLTNGNNDNIHNDTANDGFMNGNGAGQMDNNGIIPDGEGNGNREDIIEDGKDIRDSDTKDE